MFLLGNQDVDPARAVRRTDAREDLELEITRAKKRLESMEGVPANGRRSAPSERALDRARSRLAALEQHLVQIDTVNQ
jgi:hypothetical protein